jgi:hypothetical protein
MPHRFPGLTSWAKALRPSGTNTDALRTNKAGTSLPPTRPIVAGNEPETMATKQLTDHPSRLRPASNRYCTLRLLDTLTKPEYTIGGLLGSSKQ